MIEGTVKYERQFGRSLKIEELSTEFELNWSTERGRRIESYVESNSTELTEDIIRELIAVECELRIRSGESPGANEYLARFPAHAKEVREAFKFLTELQDEVSKDKHDSGLELPPRIGDYRICLLYTSPSPRDQRGSRMPSSA